MQNISLGGWADDLAMAVTQSGGDQVVATWTVGPRHLNSLGIVDGGVHGSVAETLASMGASLWFGERGTVVGVANNTDILHHATGGDLTSEARPIDQNNEHQLWSVETHDSDDRLIARSQIRLANLEPRVSEREAHAGR